MGLTMINLQATPIHADHAHSSDTLIVPVLIHLRACIHAFCELPLRELHWSLVAVIDICRVGSEANDHAVWSRNRGKCMYVCKNVLLLGPARKLCVRTPGTKRNTCLYSTSHVSDTEELGDCRRQGDREKRIARQQETYVCCSHSHHLSTETKLSASRLKAALIASREASCVLYISISIYIHVTAHQLSAIQTSTACRNALTIADEW